MPRWIDNWLDNTVSRLGFVKARSRQVDIGAVFSGESPLYAGPAWGETMSQDDWERLAITSSWVYSDIDLLSKEGGRPALEMYRREGEELEQELAHPLELLLQRPNPFMSGKYLRMYTWLWWLLRGEAYWLKVFDRTGDLAELWPIPASRMRPIPDAKKYIRAYGYTGRRGEPEQEIPAGQIVFFRFPNPFDYHRGLSPITAYAMALKTDLGAQKWNQGAFDEGIPFRVILSVPENMTTSNITRLRQEIRDEFEQRKRMLVVRGGDLKAQELGVSHQDMEFLAGREFTREEIDRVYGIPAGFWAKEATRANSEAAEASFINYAVWPRVELFTEQINVQLVQPQYGEDYTLQAEDIRPRDRKLEMEEEAHQRGVWTFNQARAAQGDEDYDGPLAELIGSLPFPLATNPQFLIALMGYDPAGPVEAAPVPMAGSGAVESPEPPEEPEEPEEPDEAEGMAELAEKAMRDDLRRWESIARRRVKNGDDPDGYEFISQYIPSALKAQIAGLLSGAGDEAAVADLFRFTKAMDLADMEQRLESLVQATFSRFVSKIARSISRGEAVNLDPFSRALEGDLGRMMSIIATEQALRLAAETQLEFDPAIVNEAATAWARTYTQELVRGLTETTRKVIQQAIEMYANTPGMTLADLTELLIPAFGEYRARMIAVTEITRAYAQAASMYQALLRDMGLEFVRTWRTNRDEKVCPICGPLDGQPERVWAAEFPDGPPAHPNCRCMVTLSYQKAAKR